MVLPGVRLVGVVERQAHAAAVIADRMVRGAMDAAPIWDALESFDGRAFCGRVDLVTAGIPCQGNSVAGNRGGTADGRWLWPELWRVVVDCGARWLLLENVAGLLTAPGDPLGEILGTLAASGWHAEWDHVSAAAVGAVHARDRLFLLAADARALQLNGRAPAEFGAAAPESAGPAADADGQRLEGGRDSGQLDGGERPPRRRDADRRGGARGRHADPHQGLSEATRRGLARVVGQGSRDWDWWRAPEPLVCRVDDGAAAGLGDVGKPAAHADELYALGNGVVPHAAAYALTVLWERLHGASIHA